MSRLEAALRGIWGFVVGDDWRTALGVVVALGATALVATTAIAAWWVVPLAVCGLLVLSLRRAAGPPRAARPRSPARPPGPARPRGPARPPRPARPPSG